MKILTLSSSAKEIFSHFPSPEDKAIDFMIAGIKDYLKECELEILEYETKYGFSIDELKSKISSGEIVNEFDYIIEKDIMKWEDLFIEKKSLITALRNLQNLIK
ncbi:MAG: hypothetical protein ABRQ39_08560 [Candidatus Eremiobacterota bacterium]